MDAASPPDQPDLAILLPRSTYWQAIHSLHSSLPLPVDDTQEARVHRDNAAMAEVASLLPVNGDETAIAVRCVVANAQAVDCLRLARLNPDDTRHVMQCNAQSASMMRQANAARSLLLRVQAARRKREADPAACNQDAWTEHCALGEMADAAGQAAPKPPVMAPAPEPAAADPWSEMTEAERYAVTYPRRAALIRAHGGLPDDCSFPPPPPGMVRDIVTGSSRIFLELDRG
jgi:hypothetical protein